jgi:hypothetical protein
MIGEKTFEKGGEMLAALMKSYRSKINQAYLTADEELKIGLSLTISPATGTGSFYLEAGINFIAEKIKDQFNCTVEELQTDLFSDTQQKEPAPEQPEERKSLMAPLGLLPAPDDTIVDVEVEEPSDPGCPGCEEPVNCSDCEFHRGMINKAHGIKVPGNSGKCIRDGGPCEAGMKARTKCLDIKGNYIVDSL